MDEKICIAVEDIFTAILELWRETTGRDDTTPGVYKRKQLVSTIITSLGQCWEQEMIDKETKLRNTNNQLRISEEAITQMSKEQDRLRTQISIRESSADESRKLWIREVLFLRERLVSDDKCAANNIPTLLPDGDPHLPNDGLKSSDSGTAEPVHKSAHSTNTLLVHYKEELRQQTALASQLQREVKTLRGEVEIFELNQQQNATRIARYGEQVQQMAEENGQKTQTILDLESKMCDSQSRCEQLLQQLNKRRSSCRRNSSRGTLMSQTVRRKSRQPSVIIAPTPIEEWKYNSKFKTFNSNEPTSAVPSPAGSIDKSEQTRTSCGSSQPSLLDELTNGRTSVDVNSHKKTSSESVHVDISSSTEVVNNITLSEGIDNSEPVITASGISCDVPQTTVVPRPPDNSSVVKDKQSSRPSSSRRQLKLKPRSLSRSSPRSSPKPRTVSVVVIKSPTKRKSTSRKRESQITPSDETTVEHIPNDNKERELKEDVTQMESIPVLPTDVQSERELSSEMETQQFTNTPHSSNIIKKESEEELTATNQTDNNQNQTIISVDVIKVPECSKWITTRDQSVQTNSFENIFYEVSVPEGDNQKPVEESSCGWEMIDFSQDSKKLRDAAEVFFHRKSPNNSSPMPSTRPPSRAKTGSPYPQTRPPSAYSDRSIPISPVSRTSDPSLRVTPTRIGFSPSPEVSSPHPTGHNPRRSGKMYGGGWYDSTVARQNPFKSNSSFRSNQNISFLVSKYDTQQQQRNYVSLKYEMDSREEDAEVLAVNMMAGY